jgi:2-phospho-L-lactate transferase/gluconeogenesis factor (CofD/UPF0052 family)
MPEVARKRAHQCWKVNQELLEMSDQPLDWMAQDKDNFHVWVVSLHHQRGFHVDHVTNVFVD